MTFFRFIIPLALTAAVAFAPAESPAGSKKSRPVVPPDLKITSVNVAPDPFRPGNGSLHLKINVELPDDLASGTLLDVSALIASPSKRSMRFLSSRQPVEMPPAGVNSSKPQVEIDLAWDGTDQARKMVGAGSFSYEIRAKLLAVGTRGAHTKMTSWPKRGTLSVLGPAGQPPSHTDASHP